MFNQRNIEPLDVEEYDPLSDDLLLAEMVRAIVKYPEKIEIEEFCDATKAQAVKVLVVRADPRDCGKVIGKQGRMAELLRSFMTIVGIHQGYSMTVMIEGSNNRNRRLTTRRAEPDIQYKRRSEPGIQYKRRSEPDIQYKRCY